MKVVNRNDPEKLDRLVDAHWGKMLFALFLLYPIITQKTLQIFDCRNLGVDGNWYLWMDVRQQCYTETWKTYAILAVGAVLVYAIGIPLGAFLILYTHRHKLEDERCTARYGYLYKDYSVSYYSFEVLEMLRKFMLVGMLLFVMPGTVLQIAVALFITGLFLLLQLKFQPFEDECDNTCATLGLTGLFVTIFCGLVLMASGCVVTTEAELAAAETSNLIFKAFMLITNMLVIAATLYVTLVDVLWTQLMQMLIMYKLLKHIMTGHNWTSPTLTVKY